MTLPTNKIICGDSLEVMKGWLDGCVDCCVTSPPYWGLRDYGVEGQMGLEKTPEEFVEKMVAVFREVKRVMADHGTLWLNLGDSYAGGGRGCDTPKQQSNKGSRNMPKSIVPQGLNPKDLVGIPWMVAFALRADGWYLRQDIIWSKPNPMPEPVRDRCTKAHEYLFLLSKSPKYYYDKEAIKEDSVCPAAQYPKRNKRSVWTIPTRPSPEAHFATFPENLIEPCILAGVPIEVCAKCGQPRERIISPSEQYKKLLGQDLMKKNEHVKDDILSKGMCMETKPPACADYETIGWTNCNCEAGFRNGIVLDPFMGSGTVGYVAACNQRNWAGIELNPEYIEMAMRRINSAELGVPVNEQRSGQLALFGEKE